MADIIDAGRIDTLSGSSVDSLLGQRLSLAPLVLNQSHTSLQAEDNSLIDKRLVATFKASQNFGSLGQVLVNLGIDSLYSLTTA